MPCNLRFSDGSSTGIGSLPHLDPVEACEDVLTCYPEFPYIPTLPNRGLKEQIIWNDSEFLPGKVINGDRLFVDRNVDFTPAMEQVYLDYVESAFGRYAASQDYTSAFHVMTAKSLPAAKVLKCQVNGPVTMGMQVVDDGRRPVGYDAQYADMLAKMIALRARWYEDAMQKTGVPETLVVFNEPYLAALGSSVMAMDREQVRAGWEDATSLLTGAAGIHCCSNTDWGFLMSLGPAVISFDAFANAREFLLYKDQLASYLEKGGVVAWGIVPAEWSLFTGETVDGLYERYRAIQRELDEILSPGLFMSRSLVTPSCGIRTTDAPGSVRIMTAAQEISRRARADAP